MIEFESYGKIPHWTKELVISEKIDGTNAQIHLREIPSEEEWYEHSCNPKLVGLLGARANGGSPMAMYVGSRNRYITPEDDNFGFAAWVQENMNQLSVLGPGRHYGEWYGKGIQRGYGMDTRRFALFAPERAAEVPEIVDVVPRIATRDPYQAMESLELGGSILVEGYDDPEGVVIFHSGSRQLYKLTFKHVDGKWKS